MAANSGRGPTDLPGVTLVDRRDTAKQRTSAAATTPLRRFGQRMSGGWLFSVAVVLALSGVIANNLWQDYQRSITVAQQATRHMTATVAERVGRILGESALMLEAARRDFQLDNALPIPVPSQLVEERITEQFFRLPQLSGLIILDERLQETYALGDLPVAKNLEPIQALLAQLRSSTVPGLVIGRSIKERDGTGWRIPLGLRLQWPDGRFKGAIIAFVDAAVFEDYFETLNRTTVPTLNFLLANNVAIAHSQHGRLSQKGFRGATNLFADQAMLDRDGTFETPLLNGSQNWIVSYRRLPGGDLVTGAMQARSDIFHTMLLRRKTDITIVGISVIALLLFTSITGRQINRRERAEAALRRAEDHLSEAIESMSEGFALYDRGERLLLCNSKYREFYAGIADVLVPGASFEEAARMAESRSIFNSDDQGDVLQKQLEYHRSPTGVIQRQLKDGRWLRIAKRKTHDGMVVGIYTDITEIIAREETMLEAKNIAEASNRSKSEFLAVMSHELRTPLNAIIGFSEIIKDALFGPVGNEKYVDYANSINDSGSHLLELINDILDISRIEAGKFELIEENIDVVRVIDACSELLLPKAQEQGVTLQTEISSALLMIFADERSMKQILINLLTNATKFSPNGGDIIVRAGITKNGMFELAVSDSGIGIAESELENVLQPFTQVESAMNRNFEGTGLGLPLVKSLTEMHGGILELDSILGTGTTVTLRFPASRIVSPLGAASAANG